MDILIFDMDGGWGWASPQPQDAIAERVGIVGDWQTWRLLRLDGIPDAIWEAGKSFFLRIADSLDGSTRVVSEVEPGSPFHGHEVESAAA